MSANKRTLQLPVSPSPGNPEISATRAEARSPESAPAKEWTIGRKTLVSTPPALSWPLGQAETGGKLKNSARCRALGPGRECPEPVTRGSVIRQVVVNDLSHDLSGNDYILIFSHPLIANKTSSLPPLPPSFECY